MSSGVSWRRINIAPTRKFVGRGGEFSASLRHSRRYLRWLDPEGVGVGAAAKVVIVYILFEMGKWNIYIQDRSRREK